MAISVCWSFYHFGPDPKISIFALKLCTGINGAQRIIPGGFGDPMMFCPVQWLTQSDIVAFLGDKIETTALPLCGTACYGTLVALRFTLLNSWTTLSRNHLQSLFVEQAACYHQLALLYDSHTEGALSHLCQTKQTKLEVLFIIFRMFWLGFFSFMLQYS